MNFDYARVEKETVSCDICGSYDHSKLFTNDRYKMGIRTVSCKRCGLIFTNPRPTIHNMNEFYRNYYRDYYESIEVPTIEYITKGGFPRRAEIIYKFIYEHLQEHLSLKQKINVLDIGCSEGSFLKLLKDSLHDRVECFGIEPSIKFAEFAREYSGAHIATESMTDRLPQEFKKKKFDFIILNHVLEHFYHPSDQLSVIRECLEDDGFLFIEVPNILGKWEGLLMFHLAHVYQFYELSLNNLLRKVGFSIIKYDDNGNVIHPWAMTCLSKKTDPQDITLPSRDVINRNNKSVLYRLYTGIHKNNSFRDRILRQIYTKRYS